MESTWRLLREPSVLESLIVFAVCAAAIVGIERRRVPRWLLGAALASIFAPAILYVVAGLSAGWTGTSNSPVYVALAALQLAVYLGSAVAFGRARRWASFAILLALLPFVATAYVFAGFIAACNFFRECM